MTRNRRIDRDYLLSVKSLPCIACETDREEQLTPTEAHHARRDEYGVAYGMGQKAHDDETLPLCRKHHWNGVHSVLTRSEFEARYGREDKLIQATRERLGYNRRQEEA